MKRKRKMVRIHTRKLDRGVARRACGEYAHDLITHGVFAKHWREYADGKNNK